MKKTVKSIVGRAMLTVRAWKSRHEIDKLKYHESPKLNAIGHALSETLNNQISLEENKLISLIENRRNFLLKSVEIIPVIDYGAGTPDSNRTKDEMMCGVQSNENVSKLCGASKPIFWAVFLFKLIRKLKPNSCLELGSCVGISASYQAAALLLNNNGKLVTLEGSLKIAQIAKETLIGIDLRNANVIIGPFYETYINALESAKPVDFLFNDAHHDHDAVLKYFTEALPYLADEAIIVFDDISWSPGMKNAWTDIENDERVATTIYLRAMGIAIISNKKTAKNSFYIPL